jgi:hypothetical protein
MSLVSYADVQAQVETHLDPATIQEIVDWVEAQLTEEVGPPYDGNAISETHAGFGRNLFLARRVESVESVTESRALTGVGALVDATQYIVWADEGRLERDGGIWGARVTVVYVPGDNRARWRQAVIDLVRLAIDRTALLSEGVAGEFSYQAPANWEAERRKVARRLGFRSI